MGTKDMNRQLQDEILEALPQLVLRMVYKLGVHAAKGPWDKVLILDAMDHLREEIIELSDAIWRKAPYEDIIDECADIANMTLIISHNYRRFLVDGPSNIAICKYRHSRELTECNLPTGHKDGHNFV